MDFAIEDHVGFNVSALPLLVATTPAIVAEPQPGALPGWLAGDIDATPEPLAGAPVRMLRCVFG